MTPSSLGLPQNPALPLPGVSISVDEPPPACLPVRLLPLARLPLAEADVPPHDLGPMNIKCPDCGALHWMAERRSDSSMAHPKFGKCCLSGKIELPKLEPPPQPLRGLLEGDLPEAKKFRSDIRQYNMALSFTSLGADIDHALMGGSGGPPVFQLHGAMYHWGGTLLPPPDKSPKYAQLYIWDAALAKEVRQDRNPNLDPAILGALQDMLLEHNPFVPIFKDALSLMEDLEGEDNHPACQADLQAFF